jgi:type 1 fimbria pilin
MKRMRIMGLCLVAIFAMGAVLAVSASAAEPEWAECAKAPKVGKTTPTGEFSDKNCSVAAAGGKYLIKSGIGKGKKFKGTGKTSTLHNKGPFGDNAVKCTSSKDEGEIQAPNIEKNVKVVFKGCTGLAHPCTSAGAKSGEIKTGPYKGELGYISKPGKVVGVDLNNETTPGGVMAEFSCVIVNVQVVGSAIGVQLGDINKVSQTSEAEFAVAPYFGKVKSEFGEFEPVVNIPSFEGGPLDYLATNSCGPFVEELLKKECSGFAPSGQEGVNINKGENLEVKA